MRYFSEKKSPLLFLCVLCFQAFLLGYKLPLLMPFIGDQAWFYLSAREMLLTGHIPLVGIASSHPWLHQGALWTYLLSIALVLFHFSPYAGAYLAVFFALLTTILFYVLGKHMFSQRVGLLAAFFYGTSPLLTIYNRMPYHTTLIPLCTLLLIYCIYRWLQGNLRFFSYSIGLFAILYNFELATSVLWIPLSLLFIYGWWRKKQWVVGLRQKQITILSLFCFFFPMLPMLLYDRTHHYVQTAGFIAWLGYKVVSLFGFSLHHTVSSTPSLLSLFQFLFLYWQRFIFLPQNGIAAIIGCLFLLLLFLQRKHIVSTLSARLCLLFLCTTLLGFLAGKTESEAYIPMFFPPLIFLLAVVLARYSRPGYTYFLLSVLLLCNTTVLLSSNYLMGTPNGYGPIFANRLFIANQIVSLAKGKPYSIIGQGDGSQFASFTMNTQYLTWWLGHAPSTTRQPRQFDVKETNGKAVLAHEYVTIPLWQPE